VLIYDTDLLSTCLYSRYIFGRCPAWVEETAHDRTAGLYLLAGDDIPWVPDPGQRESKATREALQPLFKQMLEERNLPYISLKGPLASRLETAIGAIDALLLAR
jgi:nicotinamide riboside kinase